MASLLPAKSRKPEVFYPSSDGAPLAETSVHVDAMINAGVALRHYLSAQPAIVLADQFPYYAEGFPKLRVAPDIMVIFDVPPGARDHFKTWTEGQSPAVIFEITSAGFYRENGQRLPAPSQLIDILAQETLARQAAEQRAEQESQRANQAESEASRLREKLRLLGIDPDA